MRIASITYIVHIQIFCLHAHLVKVEGRWLEPYDGDVVLVVAEEVRKETEKDGSNLLVHQFLGASLLEVL